MILPPTVTNTMPPSVPVERDNSVKISVQAAGITGLCEGIQRQQLLIQGDTTGEI